MRSPSYLKCSRYATLTGTAIIAIALFGCSKGAQENRRVGFDANAPLPGANTITPGITMINGIPCNINDPNPQSMTSPYNRTSPCYNPKALNNAVTQQQPIVNPVAPGQQPMIAQQQPQAGPNGQQGPMMAPSYPIPSTHDDIPNIPNDKFPGRIVDKQFQLLLGAWGSQTASDTCVGDKDALPHSRWLTPPGVEIPPSRNYQYSNQQFPPDRIDFIFQHDGRLNISAQSYIMQAASSRLLKPVDYNPSNPPGIDEYALEPGSNLLHVGQSRLTGRLSDFFAQNQTTLGAILKHQELLDEKDINDIPGNVPEPSNQDYQGGAQGQPTFSIGHSESGATNNQKNSNSFQPQNLGHPHLTSPNVVTMDMAPFTAKIGLLPANPQHITDLHIDEIDWHVNANVDTTLGLDKCLDNSDGGFHNVDLK